MRSARAVRVRFAIVVAAGIVLIIALLTGGQPRAFATPANDNFPGTAIGALPYTETVDTRGATTEPDEPVAPNCGPSVVDTVWWSFMPAETAIYVVNAKGQGDFAPLFVVWQPSTFAGGGLTAVTCGATYPFPGGPIGTDANSAFQGDAGKTYYIQMGGFGDIFGTGTSSSGTVALSVTKAAPPVNDNIADALHITGLPYIYTIDLTGATVAPNEPKPDCFTAQYPGYNLSLQSTAWFTYTPAHDDTVTLQARADSPGYPGFAAWTGDPGSMREAGCGFQAGFVAKAGATYYIEVGLLGIGGSPVSPGTVSFIVDRVDLPQCAGDTREFPDPAGDTIVPGNLVIPFSADAPPLPDVVNVSTATNSDWACVTVKFAGSIKPENSAEYVTGVVLYFDTDQSINSGTLYPSPGQDPCSSDTIGADYVVYGSNASNLLANLYDTSGLLPATDLAYQFSTDDTITIVVPIHVVGDDQRFDFAGIAFNGAPNSSTLDCFPNSGHDSVAPPIAAEFGDVNCDGAVNPLDGTSVLLAVAGGTAAHIGGCPQVGAVLPEAYPELSSAHLAGDVDCDGSVTALDALALVRMAAGLPMAQTAGCPAIGSAPSG